MAEKITLTLEVDTATGKSKIADVGKEATVASQGVKNTGAELDAVTGKLDKLSGGAIGAFKSFATGAQSGITAMGGLKVAIAATGIGLLVVAILAVKSAFTSSEEGQNKYAKLMGVIGAITGNFLDLLSALGEKIIFAFENPKKAITDFANLIKDNIVNRFNGLLELVPALGKAVQQLFSGDFAGAAETATNAAAKVTLGVEDITGKIQDATDATKDFIAEQVKEAALAAEVADKRAKADLIERELLVERAKLEGKISQLKLQSKQEEQFSAKERADFLREAQKLEEGLLAKETEALTLRSESAALENSFARSNKENLDAEAVAIAAVLQQQTRRTDAAKTTQEELNTLRKESAAEAKALNDERIKSLEAIDDALRTAQEKEIFDSNKKYTDLIIQAKKYGKDVEALKAMQVAAEQAIIDKGLAEEEKRQEELIKIAEQGEKDKRAALQQIENDFLSEEDLEIAAEVQKYEELIRLAEKYGRDTKDLVLRQEQRIGEIKTDQAQKASDAAQAIKVAENDAILMGTTGLLSSLSAALGRQTAAGKIAAVAAATISTYQAAAKTFAQYGATPAGYIGIAAALATGFQQVKQILAVKNPFGGGGGSASGGGGAPSMAPPSVGQSIGLISPTDQAQAFGGSVGSALQQTPVKAYITQGEVANAVDLENVLRINSQFE